MAGICCVGRSTSDILFGAPLNCSTYHNRYSTATGYGRLLEQITNTGWSDRVLTIFGTIAFNDIRRNVGQDPVVTQVLQVCISAGALLFKSEWNIIGVISQDPADAIMANRNE